MAGEIYFKSGSKSSITTQAPLTPSYKAGTVYFAVDNTDNGFIYLDYNNKRIPMTAVASKDSANNSIISTYMASVSFDSNSSSLIFKDGNNDTHSTVLLPFLLLTGGNVTGPVNFGDSVTTDELTAGSLIVNGVARFNNGLIGNLTGNADTATSAISATKDSSNHKIVDYYVHSIAHSNNTINYSNGNGDSLGSFAIPGAFFVKGTQTSSTNAWTGALPSGVTQYYEGLSIAYFLPYEGTSTAATLNLGGLGAKPIIIGENATSAATTHYAAKNVIWMTYLTDSSINSGNGYWKVSAHRNSTYYYTTAYCTTGAGTAAKAGNVSYYTLQPGYIPVMFSYDNTAQSALTLNINSTGAKPLYINGVASSSSNYTIPKDVYMVYYDGTNYYLRTDGVLPGKMERAVADGSGNNIQSTYANSLTLSGNTLTLKNKNGDKLSEVTIAASDTKVNVTLGTTSKAYILGTTTTPTSTATGVTSIADTGVYLGTTAGELVATKFTGDLNGNAATATLASKATGDGNGNEIISKYASSLEASGTTLTLKAQNGDTLSTVTTQDTKNTAGSSQKATKIYIIGAESQATSAQTYSSSKVYITDGTVTATTFSGDLSGNATSATTATSATNDSANHKITDHYVHSITTSSNTLTYKDGDGDQLGTASLINSVSNTWAAGTTAGPTIKTTVNGVDGTAVAIPSASASASGIVTTGAQTFAGSKTFNSKIIGNLQGNADTATTATNDSGNHKILDWYVHSISFDSSTSKLTYTDGDGDSTDVLLPFLLLSGGNVTGPVSFGDSVSIDALTVGSLVSTGVATFNNGLVGNLTGNADTATKATQDSSGNNILNFYAHSLTSSGNTLTLKNGNGDSLSTPSIVNSISNTWTDGTSAGPTIKTTVNGISGTAVAIPSASASVSGAVTTGAQTFAGIKTFANNIVVAKASGAPDPASTPVTYTNRNSFPSVTFNSNGQYGSFIMTEYDSAFKPGVNLFFRSDTGAGNIIATYLKAEEGFYAKFANTLITGGTYTAAVTTSPYVPEKWTFNTTISPANGDIITIETPGGGHDYGVFLSIKDGDYYPIVLNGTGRLTTHYPQGTLLTLIFDSNHSATSIFPLGGGTARTTVTGGAWRVLNYYDSGNPGDWNLRQYNILAQTAITAVHAIGGTDSGYNKIDTGTPFDIRYAVMYAASDIAAGAAGSNNFVHHYSVNLRNSSNSNITFTAYKNIYIKGTISGTTFTPYSTTNPYVQDITAAEDGYVYYYIGRAYSTSAMTFDTTGRDIFVYRNGAIRKYSGNAEGSNYVNLYEARGTTTSLNKAANYVGAGAMFHLVASASTTTGKTPTDANILQMNWDNNGGYDSQFGISTSGSRGYIRSQVSAGTAWRELVTIAAGTETGSGVKPIYVSNTGAVTASSSSAGSTYVPVFLNSGTITACTSPSILVNLGSESATNVFAASPRPGVTGVLPVAHGGTGSSSFTALRAVYTESATKLSSSGHYMSASKLAINSTSEPSYNLYINGTTYHNGVVYFGNSTSFYINNSGQGRLGDITLLNGTSIVHSIASSPWPNFRWDSRAGTSSIGTGTTTYTTITQTNWANLYYQIPAIRNTYATAGDASSTVTATYQYPAYFFFREYSPTSAGARTSYYEDYNLPAADVGRTANAGYKIITTKNLGDADSRFVKKAGDTMTGNLTIQPASGVSWTKWINNTTQVSIEMWSDTTNAGIYSRGYWNGSAYTASAGWILYRGTDSYVHTSFRLYGAVWNDYAEYRISKVKEPGRCVREMGDDTLVLTTERLQLGCEIVSDTFGFAIGQTKKANTPIASSGRVLAYPFEEREEFKNHIGEPVCSGPNGTVSIMTKEEIKEYPHCIIGTISAVPDYEEWGTENIKVNGRIWIRIR